MYNITKMSFYCRNVPILHDSAAERFDSIYMCLLEGEVYLPTQIMLLFLNFGKLCPRFFCFCFLYILYITLLKIFKEHCVFCL